MARKPRELPTQPSGPDWFLVEWMRTLGVSQAELARQTGWSKATTNDIVHGRTSFYRQIINEAAAAMNLAPFELLLPPSRAMEFRQLDRAVRLAAETRLAFTPEPDDLANGTTG